MFNFMDIEKFEKYVGTFRGELSISNNYRVNDPLLVAKFEQIMDIVNERLPNYKVFFKTFWERAVDYRYGITTENALKLCDNILELINEEKKSKEKIEEGKIFESAKDKLNAAVISFKREDWSSTMNNLNTSIELALKDKLDIPTTIPNIQTNKIIEILVKHKLGPVEYLKEVQKHVFLDNKTKHQGYSPPKIDCVNAIKAITDLFARLDKTDIKLTEEIKKKIYGSI